MAAEQGDNAPRAGLFASLKGLVATLVATGRLRLSLLATELEEEKLRLLDLLVGAIAALFLLGLGLVLLLVFLAFAFWEQRLLIFGLATAFTLGAGLLLALRLTMQARQPSALFRASLHELDKDLAALRQNDTDRA